jgi:AcrR family transcriptional regulator
MADRADQILESACRLIGQRGMHDLRVEDVATSAGISPALVYYYFKTKDRLIAQAFEYADARSTANTFAGIPPSASARDRVELVLVNEIADNDVRRENWIIWSETSAAAVFDPALRESMERWSSNWVRIVADLIIEGQREGSISRSVKPADAAERLTAVVDSLGTKWMLGSMTQRSARRLIRRAIELELA